MPFQGQSKPARIFQSTAEDARKFSYMGCKIISFLLVSYFHISYLKHIYTGYKFNIRTVLQFGPIQIKAPNELFADILDKIYKSDCNKLSTKLKIFARQLSQH